MWGRRIVSCEELWLSACVITEVSDFTPSLPKKPDSTSSNNTVLKGSKNLVESLVGCDLYDGEWIKDDSYPLYKPGHHAY